ncbi:hypothetical protein N798_07090 [Knoellia flava TL1]|uniref:DUF2252 domain-containing protein n=2 Tax=Knoellia flava TaxID=913969 RepID=A0A8H9FWH2_9MICO|nr:DUF2252 domain-containing protein [Knoellia flava]KGN32741.1 hypothetical protein N798_07090 [Knoellia flava TL1]GGB87694.1 hypothetical protein GCM10011314_29370 [Knoellia flava]
MSPSRSDSARTRVVVDVLRDAFAEGMERVPTAYRTKFRSMAHDPHSFYRGSAPLFYRDVTRLEAPWVDERSSRIWVHGDLHVENFGTYLDSAGRLVFDVNDFDEAYVGHYTWDLLRFAASLALVAWQKALPDEKVRGLVEAYVRAYLRQVNHYLDTPDDTEFALLLDNAKGPVLDVLHRARETRRVDLLDSMTVVEDHQRVFTEGDGRRRLSKADRAKVLDAFERYLPTVPEDKRSHIPVFYDVRDVASTRTHGIGSAGQTSYVLLLEGHSQALENDAVVQMKQASVPALSRFVDSEAIEAAFEHEAHRTVVSQRALQAHTDSLLGHTTIDGVGYVVSEISPYEVDLPWADLTEPDEIGVVVRQLGQATAKIHCASDEDSHQDLVDFQVEEAVAASVEGGRTEFCEWVAARGMEYAAQVRTDHALFVEAFRAGGFGLDAV